MGGQTAIDLTLAHPERVAGLVLIGTAIRGAPYPEIIEGPTADLNARFEAADEAGDLDEVARLSAEEGRVGGPTRDLFLDMNGRALHANDPGNQAEIPPAWPRLSEIAAPTLLLVGRLDVEEIRAIDELAARMIPGAQLRFLDGVAHVPHLEADPTALKVIAAFVDSLAT